MSFIHRISVITLAAINPVSMDLLAPAIPYFQQNLPALDGQVFFSTYLTGLATGQFIGAFLLNGQRSAFWALLFCLVYCISSLIAGISGTLLIFLLSRFATGFSAGIVYLFCMLLVSNSGSEEEIAESYRLRNQTLLYVAALIPFVSATVISVTSFRYLITLQMAYGAMCFLLMAGFISAPLAGRNTVKKRELITRGHLIANLVAMLCWSAMLYFLLSLIPAFFGEVSPHPEWIICAGIAISAIFYRVGSILKNRVSDAKGSIVCTVLIGFLILTHYNSGIAVKFTLLGVGYFAAGVHQSSAAAKVLSASVFSSRRNTSLLTFLNLLLSALVVEVARRVGVSDALIWLGIPLAAFAFSPLWCTRRQMKITA